MLYVPRRGTTDALDEFLLQVRLRLAPLRWQRRVRSAQLGCGFSFALPSALPHRAALGPGPYALPWCNSRGWPPLCLSTRIFPLLGHTPPPPLGVVVCCLSRSGKTGMSMSLGVRGSSARSYVLWKWHLRSVSCSRGWLHVLPPPVGMSPDLTDLQ